MASNLSHTMINLLANQATSNPKSPSLSWAILRPQQQHIAIRPHKRVRTAGPHIAIASHRLAGSVLGLAPRGAPGPILQGRIGVFNVATALRLRLKL
jgi:hypothetical protein